MAIPSVNPNLETRQQNFERVLASEPFTGLKAILDKLSRDREVLCKAVTASASYEDLLARLGYRITLTKQIHILDAYTRLGLEGGIEAVLPFNDVPTQRSLPTLVHFDSTVTTTPQSAGFFNGLFTALKAQLSTQL